MTRTIAMAGVVAAAALLASGAAVAREAAGCSTKGLSSASVRVVELRVHGISCPTARRLAGRLALDLQHGRGIRVSGSSSFTMSQSSCTGCKATTSVSIGYPNGTVTIALRGGSVSSGRIPSFPTIPSGPPSGGTGSPGPVI